MKRQFIWMTVLSLMIGWALGGSLQMAYAQQKPIQIRLGNAMAVPGLDPKDQTNASALNVSNNLYDTLIYPDPEKKYIPWIAESWGISPDGLKYTFRLKKGLLFHDETEITAEDVVFSMDRITTMGGNIATNFKTIKPGSTRALDKYTVEFNLPDKYPAFMASLFLFKITNKKLVLKNKQPGRYGENGDYGQKFLQTNEAGSGPFALVEHKHGDYLKGKRFEKYSLTKRQPNSVDEMIYYFIPEMVTMATRLQKGELDLVDTTIGPSIIREMKKNPNLVVEEHIWPATWMAVMNNKKPPLDDPYVRRAINYAFNKEVGYKQILAGGRPLQGPLPEMLRECKDTYFYPYDLEKAKAMIKQSKYSADQLKGFKMEFAAVATSERFKQIGLLFCSNMQEIGLNVQMRAVRWDDICQAAQKPETAFHFALNANTAKIPHPVAFLVWFTPEGHGVGYPMGGIYYSNPKVNELIRQGDEAMDPGKQSNYYCQAQKMILDDAPVAFGFENIAQYPYWRYVKGFKFPTGAQYFEHRFDRYTMDVNDPMFRKNQGW